MRLRQKERGREGERGIVMHVELRVSALNGISSIVGVEGEVFIEWPSRSSRLSLLNSLRVTKATFLT